MYNWHSREIKTTKTRRYYEYMVIGKRYYISFPLGGFWGCEKNGKAYFYNAKTFKQIGIGIEHNVFFDIMRRITKDEHLMSLEEHGNILKKLFPILQKMTRKEYEAHKLLSILSPEE
jgi:hypothetical protein